MRIYVESSPQISYFNYVIKQVDQKNKLEYGYKEDVLAGFF